MGVMNAEVLERRIREEGAWLPDDHYVLMPSGRHTREVIDNTRMSDELFDDCARELVECLIDDAVQIDCLVVPAEVALRLAERLTVHLVEHLGRQIPVVAAKRTDPDDRRKIEFAEEDVRHVRGKSVVVVEDVARTGKSLRRAVHLVRGTGGTVTAAVAAVYNGQLTADKMELREIYAILNRPITTYGPYRGKDHCPMCLVGKRVNTEFGGGKYYVRHNGQPGEDPTQRTW